MSVCEARARWNKSEAAFFVASVGRFVSVPSMEVLKVTFSDTWVLNEQAVESQCPKSAVKMVVYLNIRNLTQGFVVEGLIPGSTGHYPPNAEYQLRRSVLDGLARSRTWDCFSVTTILIEPDNPVTLEPEARIPVDATLADQLEAQARGGTQAISDLRRGLQILIESTRTPSACRQTLARGLRVLEDFSARSGDLLLTPWREEKLEALRIKLARLTSAKDLTQTESVAIWDEIRSILTIWHGSLKNVWIAPPSCWEHSMRSLEEAESIVPCVTPSPATPTGLVL